MNKRIGGGGWGLACFLAACGQELTLPNGYGAASYDGGAGPVDGTTGVGGSGGDAIKGRLPIADGPLYTTFGGAGGDETEGPQANRGGTANSAAKAGSAGRGGASSSLADAGAAGAADRMGPPPTLLLSEYVEGSGQLKALEIFAVTGGSLEGCELRTYSNGKKEPMRLALHGELAPGGIHVLCSSGLAIKEPLLCSRSTNLMFNGDDALALACADTVHDIFGQIGVDPGDSWDVGATLDHTLRRRCTVTSGRNQAPEPFLVDAEWETFGVDTFTDLGKRRCD